MLISVVAGIAGAIVSLYMILCLVRAFLSWSPGLGSGAFAQTLGRIVDPYFAFFARIPALRTGRFDFSPILALAVLSMVGRIFATIAATGRIGLGIILALLVDGIWSAVAFLLAFVAVAMLVRIVLLLMRRGGNEPLAILIDALVTPVLRAINRVLYRNRVVDYQQGLISGLIVLVILRVAGSALVSLLVRIVRAIPF